MIARPVITLLAALALGPVVAAEPTPVTVTITNIRAPAGVLLAGAYDRESTWLGATTVARRDVPVPADLKGGTLRFELRLPPGQYALSVFQDLNGNRVLDTNFLGIPKEASGSSNDAPARFGPPKFRDALVTVGPEPLALSIRLN